MMKKLIGVAVTAAMLGVSGLSFAQGAGGGGAGGAGGGGAGSSGGAGGGGASPAAGSMGTTTPGATGTDSSGAATGSATGSSTGSATGSSTGTGAAVGSSTTTTVPAACAGLLGTERERCMRTNGKGSAASGNSTSPSGVPGGADNRYNSPASGTGGDGTPRR